MSMVSCLDKNEWNLAPPEAEKMEETRLHTRDHRSFGGCSPTSGSVIAKLPYSQHQGSYRRSHIRIYSICRVYFSRWSAPWSCSSPPKMRWKPSSATCLCQRGRKILHGLVSWLIVVGIQAVSHNSEIWHDGSADFTFLNVRHVGKNMMILSLSSTGSTGGQNHGRATNGKQPTYANRVKPVTAPRTSTQARTFGVRSAWNGSHGTTHVTAAIYVTSSTTPPTPREAATRPPPEPLEDDTEPLEDDTEPHEPRADDPDDFRAGVDGGHQKP